MIFKIGQRGLLNADPPGQRILGSSGSAGAAASGNGQLHGTVYLREFIALFLTIIYPPVGINLVLYPTGDNVKDIPGGDRRIIILVWG